MSKKKLQETAENGGDLLVSAASEPKLKATFNKRVQKLKPGAVAEYLPLYKVFSPAGNSDPPPEKVYLVNPLGDFMLGYIQTEHQSSCKYHYQGKFLNFQILFSTG